VPATFEAYAGERDRVPTFVWRLPRIVAYYANLRDCTRPGEWDVRPVLIAVFVSLRRTANQDRTPRTPVNDRRISFTVIDPARRRHQRAFNQVPEDRASAIACECPACLAALKADDICLLRGLPVLTYWRTPISEIMSNRVRTPIVSSTCGPSCS
jgi:hypothetical protein